MTTRTRYALVGAGSRAQMFLDAIAGPHADVAELVAWTDTNPGRLDWSLRQEGREALGEPVRFAPEGLAAAIVNANVDRVIVTSPDFTHAEIIATALEAGADVVVEKPLTVSEEGVRRIAQAVESTGRQVTVTFNYRYSPRNAALKEVVASGAIGDVTSVHFEWVLDTAHGADYFRRWHRDKSNSGGLLVHKSSHHFDLVNWWLADVPVRVFASGGLRFYGADNAAHRGLGPRPERGSVDSDLRDAFSLDLRRDRELKGLYFDQEAHDGYLRDRDVFDAGITIEDNLSLVVDYARGASMSYSLNAHAPWEGYAVAVNGTAGRAELTVVERGAVLVRDDGSVTVDPSMHPDGVISERTRPIGERLVVQRHFEPAEEVPIPEGEGGHGGGDAQLLRDVFVGGDEDPLGRASTWNDGVRSMAVGLAGNRSLEGDRAVRIADVDLGRGAASLTGDPS
ncbi:Gfo/Idh/MocA family protein [Demequina muriae]|uniref:Gfo/Idh/MocA family oxidoreductase n=1 Tax=Demequina muriae TaxID=3051664 RepID=A0ABT8GI20_9MICO|nr:Gfo/Idh/MocA family oxidoreductase [Demequina sp. EGI L300058]MDN4481076.1 Gfo/Idh/MocA family oxidoreductase [Demequina sp. EGI L300058]